MCLGFVSPYDFHFKIVPPPCLPKTHPFKILLLLVTLINLKSFPYALIYYKTTSILLLDWGTSFVTQTLTYQLLLVSNIELLYCYFV